jgi:Ca-activated chloride channel family protein
MIRTGIWRAVVALLLVAGDIRPSRAGDRGPVVSSYGFMQATTDEGKPAVLPLRHTEVKAQIVGVMSAVQVTQHFRNPYGKPIEAIYVFPLPHRAAVHAMTMRLGKRVITAEIKKRDEARAVYERAKRQGKTASLLEQERPNIFTQSVANILPGEQIRVALSYVEELVPTEGEYPFVFPMVVGPRYVGDAGSGAGSAPGSGPVKDAPRITPPALDPGTRSGHDVSVSLELSTGVPLSDLRSPTHRVSISQEANDLALVKLDQADRIPNRDFVVKYRLTGSRPQATLLANHDQRGGHFLLLLQPPRRVTNADTAPKEFFFVVDTSGSMSGVPLARMKKAARLCLASLRPKDTFQIIRFSTDAELFATTPSPPTPQAVGRALSFIDTLASGGGTDFASALSLALKSGRDPRRARVVLFMSDGLIGHEAEILRYVRENRAGANLFALGIGASVNRFMIDGLARIGQGEPFVLLNSEPEDVLIKRFFELVSRPALTSIQVDWGRLAVSEVTPQQPADLFADRPIVLAGRFAKGGRGEVTLRGYLAGSRFEQKIKVALPDAAIAGSRPALSYLWARRRIDELMDLHDTDPDQRGEAQEKVTTLALAYSLMSKFTSFVAVDRSVRNDTGETETRLVPQRLPDETAAPAAVASAVPPGPVLPTPVPPPAPVPQSPTVNAGAPRAALSQDRVMPGDPEVIIHAPPDAAQVTLVLPSGVITPCRRTPGTPFWQASFLIPQGTPDGIYGIRVLITLASGEQLERIVRYQVDGTAPRVRPAILPSRSRPGAEVTVKVSPESLTPVSPPSGQDIGDPTFSVRIQDEIHAAQALLPSGTVAPLVRQPDGSHALTFSAPTAAGRYPIAVVVRDHARNKTRHVLWLEVGP